MVNNNRIDSPTIHYLLFVLLFRCNCRTKTGNSTFAMSADERRSKAKELILDVKKKMGSKKMLEVMKVIKKADETALGQTKAKLLEIFRGHKEFQSRFLEHLPQQLRL
jgi:hypothetical protein